VTDIPVEQSPVLVDLANKRSQIIRAYGYIFTSELGNMVLEDIKTFCGVGKDPYTAGVFDQTAYNLGMQRVWLHIEARMSLEPMSETLQTIKESPNE
jgi:hypothetical protein